MGNPLVHEVVNLGWTKANRWSRGFVPPLRREQRYDLFERYRVHVVGSDCDLTEAVRTGLEGGGHDIVVEEEDETCEALVFVHPTPEILLHWSSRHMVNVRRLGLVSTPDHYWDLFGRSDPIRRLLCDDLLPRCRHDCSLQWNALPPSAKSSSFLSRRRFLSVLYDTYNDEF